MNKALVKTDLQPRHNHEQGLRQDWSSTTTQPTMNKACVKTDLQPLQNNEQGLRQDFCLE